MVRIVVILEHQITVHIRQTENHFRSKNAIHILRCSQHVCFIHKRKMLRSNINNPFGIAFSLGFIVCLMLILVTGYIVICPCQQRLYGIIIKPQRAVLQEIAAPRRRMIDQMVRRRDNRIISQQSFRFRQVLYDMTHHFIPR